MRSFCWDTQLSVKVLCHFVLREDLGDDVLCRASPLGTVTSGCGRHWSLKADISVEDVTVETKYYDAFLSHEWGSSGVLKVLTLATGQEKRQLYIKSFANGFA